MSFYRSYFSKNNSLIEGVRINSGLNPVTEISYGGLNQQVSRFIFDIDLSKLTQLINEGEINQTKIVKHVLHLTNTIAYAQEYIGKKSYSLGINRASDFTLELFNVNEDWEEGTGYDFSYVDTNTDNLSYDSSNWYERELNTNWTTEGCYTTTGNTTQILGNQYFSNGSENIEIDVTDYINQRLFTTGYTGTTTYTGDSFGVGIKFTDSIEELLTELKEAVAFHTRHTNTYYEPYLETIIDDRITDDRNYFFLDKDNSLYLYSSVGGNKQNVTVNNVTIYDHDGNIYDIISGNSIINVSKGIYKINLNIDSETYPDSIIFEDEWDITINNKNYKQKNNFYLINPNNYFSFNNNTQINPNNYYFSFNGISYNEKIVSGDVRKIKVLFREFKPNQNNYKPLDIEYRIFTSVADKYEIDIIPYTKCNRTNNGYEFNIDTSWLIPQDYKLQIRMKNEDFYINKESIKFTVANKKLM